MRLPIFGRRRVAHRVGVCRSILGVKASLSAGSVGERERPWRLPWTLPSSSLRLWMMGGMVFGRRMMRRRPPSMRLRTMMVGLVGMTDRPTMWRGSMFRPILPTLRSRTMMVGLVGMMIPSNRLIPPSTRLRTMMVGLVGMMIPSNRLILALRLRMMTGGLVGVMSRHRLTVWRNGRMMTGGMMIPSNRPILPSMGLRTMTGGLVGMRSRFCPIPTLRSRMMMVGLVGMMIPSNRPILPSTRLRPVGMRSPPWDGRTMIPMGSTRPSCPRLKP